MESSIFTIPYSRRFIVRQFPQIPNPEGGEAIPADAIDTSDRYSPGSVSAFTMERFMVDMSPTKIAALKTPSVYTDALFTLSFALSADERPTPIPVKSSPPFP